MCKGVNSRNMLRRAGADCLNILVDTRETEAVLLTVLQLFKKTVMCQLDNVHLLVL